jgi:hypothetical protein
MLTDKLYTNNFFIEIGLDWLKHLKGGEFLVFKVIVYVKNQPNFSLNNIKLWEELLLATLFDYFHFWSTLIFEIAPNFWQAPINPNQFWWKNDCHIIYQWKYTNSLYLFGPKIHNYNHANLLFSFSYIFYQTEASVKGGQGGQLPPHFLAAAAPRRITTCSTSCPPTLKSYWRLCQSK